MSDRRNMRDMKKKRIKRTLGVLALLADLLTGCVVGVADLDNDMSHSGWVEDAVQRYWLEGSVGKE